MRKLLVFAVLIFASCGGNKYQKLQEASTVAKGNFDATIPFVYEDNVMIIEVIIKHKTCRLIFDTGASSTLLSKQVADALGLKPAFYLDITDSREQTEKLPFSSVDTLQLGGVNFLNQAVVIAEWPPNSIFACEKIDGLLGITAIKNAHWVIDYKKREMRLSSKPLPDTSGYVFSPLKYANTRPSFDIVVDAVPIKDVLMDLGSGGFIDLDKRSTLVSFEYRLSEIMHGKHYDGATQGIFGSLMDTVLEIKPNEVRVGEAIVYNPIITLETDKTAKFGNRFYQNYTLYLDFQNKRFGLKPNQDFTVYKGERSFGFVPFLEDSVFSIVSIHSNSKAFADGFRAGDEVVALNGTTAQMLKYDFCDGLEFLNSMKNIDTTTIIFAKQPEVTYTYYRAIH